MRALRHPRRGFTIIEVVISLGLLLLLMAFVGYALQASARAASYDLAYTEASSSARKILQQLVRELSSSGGSGGVDYVDPTRNAGGTQSTLTLSVQTSVGGVGNPNGVWGTPITYSLSGATTLAEANATNNVDDDHDGVIDEQALVRTQDGATVVLDHFVTDFVVDRALADDDLIRLTIEVARPFGEQAYVDTNGEHKGFAKVRMTTTVMVQNQP